MPVTEWDEYYIHQIQDTIDRVNTADPGAYERTFIGCHNADGTLHLMMGLGVYPNKNIMDGFVCVRYKNVQRNIRISRHLKGDRVNTEVGPLNLKVIQPLKRGGVYLGDNDYGIGCSLEFEGQTEPLLRPHYATQVGFDQGLRFKGSITFEGQKIDADGFMGVRDRTWGIRHGGAIGNMMTMYAWIVAHFLNFFLVGQLTGGGVGAPPNHGLIVNDDGSQIPILDIRHRLEFVSGFRQYTRMDLLLKDINGQMRHLTCNPISPECYGSGAGYYDRHGLDRGPFLVEGERWDVAQPVGLDSALYGMHQRDNDFELDGEKGVGFIETMFNQAPTWQYTPTW